MSRPLHSETALRRGTVMPVGFRAVPVVVLVFTVLFQLLSPEPAVVGFPTAMVPLVAAFVLGPLWIMGMAVVVAGLLMTVLRPDSFDTRDLFAYVIVWTTGIGFAWVRKRYQARLVTIENVAEAAQYAVLPSLPERVDGLRCAGLYHSAQDGARIGGDLFDVRTSPFGLRLILGDVQGHGLPAVNAAGKLLSCFHEAILDEPELEGIASRLERRLLVEAEEGYIPELFASALLVEFREDTAEIRLLSCGHPPPLLLRGGAVEEVDLKPRPLLGLRLESRKRPPSVMTVPFRSGEALLAYSDGVIEVRDSDGHYYPLTQRLNGRALPPSPQEVIGLVWDDLTRFAARLDDDVSLLVVTPAVACGRSSRRSEG
jgi:hypothetical protein